MENFIFCAVYIEELFSLVSAVTECLPISASVSLIDILIVTVSSAVGLKFVY